MPRVGCSAGISIVPIHAFGLICESKGQPDLVFHEIDDYEEVSARKHVIHLSHYLSFAISLIQKYSFLLKSHIRQ